MQRFRWLPSGVPTLNAPILFAILGIGLGVRQILLAIWAKLHPLKRAARARLEDADSHRRSRLGNSADYPEWIEIRSWDLQSPLSTVCVHNEVVMFGTRYGLIGELETVTNASRKPPYKERVDLSKRGSNLSKGSLDADVENPRRYWWTGGGEILSIAALTTGYIAVNEHEFGVLSKAGFVSVPSLQGVVSVAATKTDLVLCGMDDGRVSVYAVALTSETSTIDIVPKFELDLVHFLSEGDEGEPDFRVCEVDVADSTGIALCRNDAFVFCLTVDASQIPVRLSSAKRLTCVALARGGTRAATAQVDGTCTSWDVTGRRVMQTFLKHQSVVYSLDMSDNGKTVVSGSGGYNDVEDFSVWVWDAETGGPRHHFAHHSGLISAVSLSSNGSILTTSSWDGCVRRLDLKYGDRARFFLFLLQASHQLPLVLLQHIFSFMI